MKLTTSTAVAILSIIASVSAADSTTTASPGGVNVPVGNPNGSGYKSVDLDAIESKIRAAASSQITESAIAAQLKTISETSGHDVASEIAYNARHRWDSGTQTLTRPAWLTAAGTKGPLESAYIQDANSFENLKLNGMGATTTSSGMKVTSSGASAASAATDNSKSSSSSAGAAAQPTGVLMAAGAAAAGVLGVAAML